MSKKVAILQSSYIPWKGYFDLVNRVDEFILYDDMQYTRRDWRNRNKIKTKYGIQWLTIPVLVKGKYFQKIRETKVADRRWASKHWKAIILNYSRAGYFELYKDRVEQTYKECEVEDYLSCINLRFIRLVSEILGIKTRVSWSMNYEIVQGKTERLVDMCKQAGATEYVTGPSAQAYVDETLFAEANIHLSYMDYSGYPQYSQLSGKFEHHVSILDLIFNEGPGAKRFMKSF